MLKRKSKEADNNQNNTSFTGMGQMHQPETGGKIGCLFQLMADSSRPLWAWLIGVCLSVCLTVVDGGEGS